MQTSIPADSRFVFHSLMGTAPPTVVAITFFLFVLATLGLAALLIATWIASRWNRSHLLHSIAHVLGVGLGLAIVVTVHFQIALYHPAAVPRFSSFTHGALYALELIMNVLLARTATILVDSSHHPVPGLRWVLWAGPFVAVGAFVTTTACGFTNGGVIVHAILWIVVFLVSVVALQSVRTIPMVWHLRRGLRHAAVIMIGFLIAGAVVFLLRVTASIPTWVSPVLLVPLFVGALAGNQLYILYGAFPREEDPDLGGGGKRPQPARRWSDLDQEHFFSESITEFGLTKREASILLEVMQGRSNEEIAGRFDISEKTVRNHISNIYAKTSARNRIDLINTFQLA